MFSAAKGVERSSRRAPARSYIYNISETLFLYYNSLISMLCREKEVQRQGLAVFCLSMIKLCLIVLLLSPVGVFAAEKKKAAPAKKRTAPSAAVKKQPAPPPVKVTTKTDEVMLQEQRARLDEISAIEKAPGAAKAASLKPMLSDKNPLIRGEAAEAIGKTKEPAALGELSAAVKSEDDHTRWGAVRGLAALGDKKALPPLIAALGHPEYNTRWKAAQALGELKDAGAVDALAAAAGSDKSKNVRLAAIEALMKIGGAKAAAAAEGLKNDPDPEIKAWAGAAAEKLK